MVLFPETEMRNVLFMSKPESLHSGKTIA